VSLRGSSIAERLRDVDGDDLLYASTNSGPGRSGPLPPARLQLLDRVAALVPPPRVHGHRYFDVPAAARRATRAR